MRRFLPPAWFLIATLLMAVLHFSLPVYVVFPTPINLYGLAFGIAGLLIFGGAVRCVVRAKTTIKPFQESSVLISTGPFRISRNPIYLGMALLLLGVAILFGSLTPLLVIPVFILLIDRVFICSEQHMLHATFGDEYTEYCHRVRRWI